jgi:hypothetical protein
VLGLSRADRLVIVAVASGLGALLGLLVRPLAGWLLALPLLPFRRPLEAIDAMEGPWATAGLTLLGLLVGLGLAFLVVATAMTVTVGDDEVRIEKDGAARTLARREVDAVFLDGKKLVVLDRASRQLLRDASEAKATEIARAFTAHGYPWVKRDPYAELYRRWVPDTPDLPGAVNALLKAREAALKKRAGRDVAELRDEVQKLGFVVRETATRQYWRPLIRS